MRKQNKDIHITFSIHGTINMRTVYILINRFTCMLFKLDLLTLQNTYPFIPHSGADKRVSTISQIRNACIIKQGTNYTEDRMKEIAILATKYIHRNEG